MEGGEPMTTKAIYQPKGKAGEYAKYACNFYVGCSNDCDYCYCKRGVLAHSMGKPQATLKKCFKDEDDALRIFERELYANLDELRKHGLFLTFTSDPMIEECHDLTIKAVDMAVHKFIRCKILTKRADFDIPARWFAHGYDYKPYIAFGFTLTGCDELEPKASTNDERINTMCYLHDRRFKTFASIEPVIDIKKSMEMIEQTLGYCDLYMIGLISGKRNYTPQDVMEFIADTNKLLIKAQLASNKLKKVYWKDSVLDYIGMSRDDFNEVHKRSIVVNADYNLFNQ